MEAKESLRKRERIQRHSEKTKVESEKNLSIFLFLLVTEGYCFDGYLRVALLTGSTAKHSIHESFSFFWLLKFANNSGCQKNRPNHRVSNCRRC